MVWIVGSLIIVGVSSALIAAATRRRPRDGTAAGDPSFRAAGDQTLATRVRRVEDELDDLASQVSQLRDDVQYLLRQLEERP